MNVVRSAGGGGGGSIDNYKNEIGKICL